MRLAPGHVEGWGRCNFCMVRVDGESGLCEQHKRKVQQLWKTSFRKEPLPHSAEVEEAEVPAWGGLDVPGRRSPLPPAGMRPPLPPPGRRWISSLLPTPCPPPTPRRALRGDSPDSIFPEIAVAELMNLMTQWMSRCVQKPFLPVLKSILFRIVFAATGTKSNQTRPVAPGWGAQFRK